MKELVTKLISHHRMNNAHKHTACLGYVDFKLGQLGTSNRAGPDYRGIGLPGQQGRATSTAGPGYLDRGAGLPGPQGQRAGDLVF